MSAIELPTFRGKWGETKHDFLSFGLLLPGLVLLPRRLSLSVCQYAEEER